MFFKLTIIKRNHSKSKYPTHKRGITWQSQVHWLVTPQGRLQKYPSYYVGKSPNWSGIKHMEKNWGKGSGGRRRK